MILVPDSPWPKTLTAEELSLVAVLSDIIVPTEGSNPSATDVNVPDVIDEWVSAPYEQQQKDRLSIIASIQWINDEAKLRFLTPFVRSSKAQQLSIMDDISYTNKALSGDLIQISQSFPVLRNLVLAAYFCSPQGTKDLGYQGNVAIMGDYPGPTDEAMNHLNSILVDLDLV